MSSNTLPRLHNAMWPGLVGKGDEEGQEPPISLERMLELTAGAEVNGQKFDGIDYFLFLPHTDPNASDDELKRIADLIAGYGFASPACSTITGCASTARSESTRRSSASKNGEKTRRRTPRKSPRRFAKRPKSPPTTENAWQPKARYAGPGCTVGRTCSTFWRPSECRNRSASRPIWLIRTCTLWATTRRNMRFCSPAIRRMTIDFHVAQNDGEVHGAGSHDKTGKHCQADDPNGKLDIVRCAGYWLKDAASRGIQHICWDGCMFPNAVLESPDTWNAILDVMLKVRAAHGWT